MLQTIAAHSPILLLLALLLVLRRPLVFSAPATFVYTLLFGAFLWEVRLPFIGAAVARGAFISLDILIVVTGAVFFLEYLKETGIIRSIERSLALLSPDRRIQAVLIAWLFGGFIEGAAGFGTPAAIVAPLLVALGFPPMTAVLISLTANSTPVTFGAVGTPVRVGLAGLELSGVVVKAALLSAFAGLLLPTIIMGIVIRASGRWSWGAFFAGLPWALWAALAFFAPYVALSFLGPEFPSLGGAAIGLALVSASLRFRFLLPKETFRFPNDLPAHGSHERARLMPFFPYAGLALILLAGKWIFFDLRYTLEILPQVRHTIGAFNPGFAFFTTVALLQVLRRDPIAVLEHSARRSLERVTKPLIALFFVTATVQILVLSNNNFAGRPGVLGVMAASWETPWLPYFSSAIGAFGSFIAGSATVSNLLFAEIQLAIATSVGSGATLILALQLAGAGAGNMIALPNILAVEATVGASNREFEILRSLWPICALYLVMLAIGMHLVR